MVPRPFPSDGEGAPEPPGGADSPSVLVLHSDDTKSTSWVHPGTGYSIQSGHFSCAGEARPRLLGGHGWEVWSEIPRECQADPPKLSQQELGRVWGLVRGDAASPQRGFSSWREIPGGFFPSLLRSLQPAADKERPQTSPKIQFEPFESQPRRDKVSRSPLDPCPHHPALLQGVLPGERGPAVTPEGGQGG